MTDRQDVAISHGGHSVASWQHHRPWDAVGQSCINIAVIVLVMLVAVSGGCSWRGGTAHADNTVADRPRLKAYEEVKGFYELAISNDAICTDYLDAVNGEKIYDPNDERDLLLGSAVNSSWDILFASGQWAVPTSGNWQGHRISTDEWIHNTGSGNRVTLRSASCSTWHRASSC